MRKRLILLACAGLLVFGCRSNAPTQIGAVLPLTGEADYYGNSIEQGVELAYTQIQADANFPHKIVLKTVDSKSDPERAHRELQRLYGDGALAVIGGVTSAEALAMIPVADKYDRVLLSPSASSPELTGISTNFFRVFPSDFLGGTKMGNFATQTLNLKTAVILAKKETYAKGVQQIFKTEFERQGGKILETIDYPPGTSDFTGVVERVLKLAPDGVYLAGFAHDIAAMITGLRGAGYKGILMTTDAFAAPKIIEETGAAANGIYLTQTVFDAEGSDPNVKGFVDAFKAQHLNEAPNLYTAQGYDAMMVIGQAIKEGGASTTDFWKGMRSIRAFPGVTGSIQFDEKGDVQKFPRVYVIVKGRLVDYDTEVTARRRELMERLRKLKERSAKPRSGD